MNQCRNTKNKPLFIRSTQIKYFLIILLVSYFYQSNNLIVNAPDPILTYQNPFIEAGIVFLQIGIRDFYVTNDMNASATDYYQSYQIPFNRINLLPAFTGCIRAGGFQSTNFAFNLQTDGFFNLTTNFMGANQTYLGFQIKVNYQANFYMLGFIYFVVENTMVNPAHFLQMSKYKITVSCDGTSGSTTCTSLYNNETIPSPTVYRFFISLRDVSVYRDNAIPRFYFDVVATQMSTSTVRFDLSLQGCYIEMYAVNLLIIHPDLFDVTNKKSIHLTSFIDAQPATSVLNQNSVISIPHPVFTTSFFVGVKRIDYTTAWLLYSIYINTTDSTLNQFFNYIGTDIDFDGFAIYGFNCPYDEYYMSDVTYKCQSCSANCKKCLMFATLRCLQCNQDYVLQPDNLTCTCSYQQISGVCGNFTNTSQEGCDSMFQLNNGTFKCVACNSTLFLVLQNNECVCTFGYSRNPSTNDCQQICGDSVYLTEQCDDGNTISGDGCSSTCLIEDGFQCDNNHPTYCMSKIPLRYSIYLINKDQTQYIAEITLKLSNSIKVPYPILISWFQQESKYLKLKVMVSQSPYLEKEIKDLQISQLNLYDYTMKIKFNFDYTVENLKTILSIDYQGTRYFNYTQDLEFTMKGSNQPLVFSSSMQTYKQFGTALMSQSIVNVLSLFFGLLSSKYIGMESIITLQLIFYSQLLIHDVDNWPVGFMYLKYLKYSTGFNKILTFTSYLPFSQATKKLSHLEISKTILQNFNLSFGLLIIFLIVFTVFSSLRYFRQKQLDAKWKAKRQINKNDVNQKKIYSQQMENFQFFIKWEHKTFWMINHLCLWTLLPLMSSFTGEIFIQNSLTEQIVSASTIQIILIVGRVIAQLSFVIILFISFNNFRNVWLSQKTIKKLMKRPEQVIYKQSFLIYLMLIGFIVFFFNQISFSIVPISVLVVGIQVSYMIALLIINPYQQSLKIHTVTLMLNHAVYLVFLVIVNLMNFVPSMNDTLSLVLGYFITCACGILIISTMFRFYYEYRYGQALQIQLQKQRDKQQQQQKALKQAQLRKKANRLEQQAKNKLSAKQKIRAENSFLFQNQQKVKEKWALLDWLQTRNWDPQQKQKYYFKRFTQKPLEWLKQNDIPEYRKKMQLLKKIQQNKSVKNQIKFEDSEYIEISDKLKKQFKKRRRQSTQKVKSHRKKLLFDPGYAMKAMKNQNHKCINQNYELKD